MTSKVTSEFVLCQQSFVLTSEVQAIEQNVITLSRLYCLTNQTVQL